MSGVIITVSQDPYLSAGAQDAIQDWENRRAGQGRLSCDDSDHEMVSTLKAEAQAFIDELMTQFEYCDFHIVITEVEE